LFVAFILSTELQITTTISYLLSHSTLLLFASQIILLNIIDIIIFVSWETANNYMYLEINNRHVQFNK